MAEMTREKIARNASVGSTKRRPADGIAPRFRVGDRVRARNDHPPHHTRLPRYVMGRAGEVVLVHGVFVFPDSNASHQGEKPQYCYGVRFPGRELWGMSGHPADSVTIDLFDDYLEPA